MTVTIASDSSKAGWGSQGCKLQTCFGAKPPYGLERKSKFSLSRPCKIVSGVRITTQPTGLYRHPSRHVVTAYVFSVSAFPSSGDTTAAEDHITRNNCQWRTIKIEYVLQ
ncbi:hypothetical protein HispidOSU_000797 [Sigmodon hispidus]